VTGTSTVVDDDGGFADCAKLARGNSKAGGPSRSMQIGDFIQGRAEG
jgi:hypothetical protein